MSVEYFIGNSVWTVLSSIGGFIAVLVGVCTYCRNSRKSRSDEEQDRSEKRSAYLERLLDSFAKNRVLELVSISDASEGTDKFFTGMQEQIARNPSELGENRRLVEQTLRFMEWVFYLTENKKITDSEFLLFESDFIRVLSDPHIQTYLFDSDNGYCPEESSSQRWPGIRSFMEDRGFPTKLSGDDLYSLSSKVCKADESRLIEEEGEMNELKLADFDEPTMIIKINKKYSEGMSDKEVYEAVRGCWLVDPEKANHYRVVLAVAFGIVHGVYFCKEWIRVKDSPRCFFVRDVIENEKELSARQKYEGKSVKALFARGASNPIRYLDPQNVCDA